MEGRHSSDVSRAHAGVCTCERQENKFLKKTFHLPDVGKADDSYFQRGAEPSNQRWHLQSIISLSLIKTMWKCLQSQPALVPLHNLQHMPIIECGAVPHEVHLLRSHFPRLTFFSFFADFHNKLRGGKKPTRSLTENVLGYCKVLE